MKTASVVIGANYGDEGKGLMTDYYAHAAGHALVVRFNGGAQAGHTVTTPDARRHVFSHIGSGNFAGAETFLSRFFVCNPLLFRKEHDALAELTPIHAIHVDDASPVTTPYDMMINQIAEDLRGNTRHGSCGMGFGETIERTLHAPLALYYRDLADKAGLKDKLRVIRAEWLPQRLAKLGFPAMPEKWQARVYSDALLDKFIEDADFFRATTRPAHEGFLSGTSLPVVFEGAQGLMLDQDRGQFPHVTRSNTGIRNVLALAAESGLDALDVTYGTRAYLTRHGAGPLAGELASPPFAGIVDKTNVLNEWQGRLRFALLDITTLAKYIRHDLSDNRSLKIRHGVAVTCLDQADDVVRFMENGREKALPQDEFVNAISRATGASFIMESRGPARNTITPHQRAAA